MNLLLYVVFLIILQAPRPSTQQAANPSAKPSSPAQDQIREVQPTPIIVNKLPSVTVAATKRDWVDWGYWVFSGLLVVVGGLQVLLLWRTLGAMKEQANLMERQATANENAVTAAQDNAKAALAGAEAAKANAESAEATVKQMRSSARRELRARVSVVSARRLGTAARPGSYQAEITFRNFGKVTAYRCTCTVALVLRPNNADDSQFPPARLTGDEPNVSLPPGGEFTVVRHLEVGTFEGPQHSAVMVGTSAVYFYGKIMYRDGFKSGRYSDFRMKCCGPDYSLNRFAFCEKGNRAG
jgi:hypothetical protein